MAGNTLVFSDFYQWFEICVYATPESLGEVGYFIAIYDSNGTERLDGSEYANIPDAIAEAKLQIERYWEIGGKWSPQALKGVCDD